MEVNYSEDKYIPNTIYCNYMKKYAKTYQLKKMEDGIIAIKCKFGTIEPNGISKGTLGYWGFFHSLRKTNSYKKRLPDWVEITQDASDGFSIKFPESRITELETVLEIRKKKKLSAETLDKLRQNMKKALIKKESQKSESIII
jgi:hypothetical protein